MTRLFIILGALGTFLIPLTRAATNNDRFSFFHVPLGCGAAPEIGCGSRAKPALLQLQRDPAIAEAWLNEAGTILAVIGAEGSTPKSRAKAVQTVFESVGELRGEARDNARRNFQSRNGWYRGADVDRLSEKEAAIIAQRLVQRTRARVSFSDQQAADLQAALTAAIARHLIAAPRTMTTEELGEELLRIASERLDTPAVAALKEALPTWSQPEERSSRE